MQLLKLLSHNVVKTAISALPLWATTARSVAQHTYMFYITIRNVKHNLRQ